MVRKMFAFIILAILAMGCDDSSKGGESDGGDDERGEALCADGIDNDGDSATDCDDDGCAEFCIDTVFEPDTVDSWDRKSNRGEVHDPGVYVSDAAEGGAFALVTGGKAATLVVSDDDFDGVKRVVEDLKTDIGRVAGVTPAVVLNDVPKEDRVVIVGTVGKSALVDSLVDGQKLDAAEIKDKWETFIITRVEDPIEGVAEALVIAGSDQRGTIYGVYDLCSQIGVSPWHFWADVPPQQKDELHVLEGVHTQGEPAVKYRGIFINDENPALDLWHRQYFPDEGYEFGKGLYAKVFEVMLRLKANYLWPAVWGRAFAEDDPENHAEAKRYGIVMGTSHEAPMMRGIEEWNRGVDGETDAYGGNGDWSYRTNPEAVEAYWRDGIKRMVDEDFEGVVTIGMRGPGDVKLKPQDGVPLANDFIASQRKIINEETGLHPAQVPQVWTLYKEVLNWWEEDGLRAPGDVTIIWPDDNWGNLRKLKDPDEPERPGGYGLYYHFDYVGAPRNYKWVDTQLLPNVWEQLHLAYERGVNRLWVVNVGDMKGNELPLQFFMDYAWNPERWSIEKLSEWEKTYAAQQFGSTHAEAVAKVLHDYSLLQSDRKPELLNVINSSRSGCPFSLTNYQEMERVVEQWRDLSEDAEALVDDLGEAYQDAYFQLVLYPVKASALMYELRLAGFNNLLYEKQGRSATNDMADIAEEKFEQSRDLADHYNTGISDGKWEGFQTQPYLGYSSWQQPEEDNSALPDFIYPELKRIEIPDGADMAVAIDGSESVWPEPETDGEPETGSGEAPEAEETPALPVFSPYQVQPKQYIEVFNRGSADFEYEITMDPEVDWLKITPSSGTITAEDNQVRATLEIDDWSTVPTGTTTVRLTVTNVTDFVSVDVMAIVDNPETHPENGVYVESNGYVSMEAAEYSRIVDKEPFTWKRLPDIGRTGDGMTPFPVTAESIQPGGDSARLEYDLHLFTTGKIEVFLYLSPRQNVLQTDALSLGLSVDDGDIELAKNTQLFGITPEGDGWKKGVANNTVVISEEFEIEEAGSHVLKVWAVDPTVVLQKIVIDTGGVLSSYLGPPESMVAGD